MSVAIIVCMANNLCIGKEGKIPWHLRSDLKRFKDLTSGQALIMGSKTYESIGRPLPDRLNIVLSRTKPLLHYDKELMGKVAVVNTMEQALVLGKSKAVTFIIGGEEVYKTALEMGIVDKIYLSILPTDYEGDTFFPDVEEKDWRVVEQELVKDGSTYYKFIQLEKVKTI